MENVTKMESYDMESFESGFFHLMLLSFETGLHSRLYHEHFNLQAEVGTQTLSMMPVLCLLRSQRLEEGMTCNPEKS